MSRAHLFLVMTVAVASCAEPNDDGLKQTDKETVDSGADSGGEPASGGSGGLTVVGSGGSVTGGSGGIGGGSGGTSGGSGGSGSGGTGGTAGAGGSSASGSGGGSSGGGGGSGGSGGTGGSATGGTGGTGTGGTGTGGTGGAPATGLVVQYQVEINGASGSAIGSQLWVVNNGSATVNLSGLTLRYYFTNEVTGALVRNINWANVGPVSAMTGMPASEITIDTAAMTSPVSSADTYVEFTFGSSSRTLSAGHGLQFSWTVQNYSSQNFVQTGDYSYNSSLTTKADWAKVVLYQGQSLIWGTEPT